MQEYSRQKVSKTKLEKNSEDSAMTGLSWEYFITIVGI